MDATAQTIRFIPQSRKGILVRLGDAMQRNRRAILAIQWVIVAAYVLLVVVPAFLPLPQTGETILSNLTLFAQFAFWGIWWPFVILSIMLMGRVWCGVFCPEGALTEFASRHGRGGVIPKWVRWSGWPVVAFIATTVYGQLISVYDYPQAALLILGGSTVAAMMIGWLYGKGKRVWCRYLCPVSGVFALLARLAPVYFRVDRASWDRYPGRTGAVDCAPLLNVKRLNSTSQCHACGRCSGHRNAVQLAARSPSAEILAIGGVFKNAVGDNGTKHGATVFQHPAQQSVSTAEAVLLIFGLLGVSIGAFQWTVSPWFIQLKQHSAEWLMARDIFWPLQDSTAWWLLTRYPAANDVFTWLDGTAILAYIGAVALVLGGAVLALVSASARLARTDWRLLAMGMTPLAGIGLFLGLSMMTVSHLRAEGILLPWLPWARGILLGLGVLWSLRLGIGLLRDASPVRQVVAFVLYAATVAIIGIVWGIQFYVW